MVGVSKLKRGAESSADSRIKSVESAVDSQTCGAESSADSRIKSVDLGAESTADSTDSAIDSSIDSSVEKRVRAALSAFKNGEMIIIMDDEERENEGDLVYAGIFSTAQKVNFMATYARGLICVAIDQSIATKLDLTPMVAKNSSNHETAFTISIDAASASTGISAQERDLTIRLMCEDSATPADFVRPGHIFPLIAKGGGVLERTGHTEAGVDLCRLAGLKPTAVICEIMKEDGSMARRGDKFLLDFARTHNLAILYVSDLVAYRLKYEQLITRGASAEFVLLGHKCLRHAFKDFRGREHVVFEFVGGDFNVESSADSRDAESSAETRNAKPSADSKPRVKFHTIRSDLELLESPTALNDLLKSIEILRQSGGFLIALNTEQTSGESLSKRYGIGAQILRVLGIQNFVLLSNSHKTNFIALSGFGLSYEQVHI